MSRAPWHFFVPNVFAYYGSAVYWEQASAFAPGFAVTGPRGRTLDEVYVAKATTPRPARPPASGFLPLAFRTSDDTEIGQIAAAAPEANHNRRYSFGLQLFRGGHAEGMNCSAILDLEFRTILHERAPRCADYLHSLQPQQTGEERAAA
jgi:hypothetical protein